LFALSRTILLFLRLSVRTGAIPPRCPQEQIKVVETRPMKGAGSWDCTFILATMANTEAAKPASEVGILILDSAPAGQQALRLLLSGEGWHVQVVTDAKQTLQQLLSGAWNLVIANVELAPPGNPLFQILKDLAHAEGVTVESEEEEKEATRTAAKRSPDEVTTVRKRRLRVLFLVPSSLAADVVMELEQEELPYSILPYHFHDFFEKISDLLIEAGAISKAARASRFETTNRARLEHAIKDQRGNSMFSSRREYQMTEEEIAEYERQEEAERRKKNKREKEEEREVW
jgi:CheY-like chemotaxis protein